jgi:hypothetical protein
MIKNLWKWAFLALVLSACATKTTPLTEVQVIQSAWQALEPNTSSHAQANWETSDLRSVSGSEIGQEFEGEPARGCVIGPIPPPNQLIDPEATYWYVQLQPRVVTPLPGTLIFPTSPPDIPEPFIYRANFLVDPDSGEILARKLFCVIY